MRQTIDPTFEFNWRAALWAAGVLAVVTGIGIGLYSNLRLFGYGTILAGFVASLRCSYYQSSENSAVMGVVLVSLVFVPLFLFFRMFAAFGAGVGDSLFITTSFGLAWFAIVAIGFVPVAYLSAAVGDFLRKKASGPIGYDS